MDYKGYNIAIHEFGHNVEQTISLYDVDYYMLNGVPNTAFTEALAFVFQKRDLELLGIKDENPEKEKMDILDKIWSMYEICGVSMLDISVWKWMYAHPNATAGELQEAVIRLSKEIWNKYYAPVFGVKDETVLAIYFPYDRLSALPFRLRFRTDYRVPARELPQWQGFRE